MNSFLIGISGPSGSGKSMIAGSLAKFLKPQDVVIIAEDSYYKDLSEIPFDERTRYNFDHPDALDHALLAQHLNDLAQGKEIEQPIYDFKTHTRKDKTRIVKPHQWIIVEGILIFVLPRLTDQMDFKIFVDTPLDTCFIRRLKRDIQERGRSVDSVITQYLQTVRPMYFAYIEPTRKHADILVSNDGQDLENINSISVRLKDRIVEKIQSNSTN